MDISTKLANVNSKRFSLKTIYRHNTASANVEAENCFKSASRLFICDALSQAPVIEKFDGSRTAEWSPVHSLLR